MRQSLTLGDIAEHIDAKLIGNAELLIQDVATLGQALPGTLSFLSHKKYQCYLATTKATAVILSEADAAACPTAALIHSKPYLAYAKAVKLLHPLDPITAGIHPTAVVDATAQVHESAHIGPLAVIGANVKIGARVLIGPACIIGPDCQIGLESRLLARVTLCHGTLIGCRVIIQPGAVLGSDGFGFARENNKWLRIPQIGRVIVGNDVEIGANTTIDRGSLEETIIADGAILDNLIQIGHNVHIGQHTAVVACTGISGSTKIGQNCLVGGDVGIAGHLKIGDGVHLAAGSKVTRDLPNPGNYGGVLPVDVDPLWRRNIARLRHLDELVRRVKKMEHQLGDMVRGEQLNATRDDTTPDI